MCGLGFLASGSVEEGVRLAIRETARTTLLIFVVIFCTSAIRRRWRTPLTNYLMRNRRYLGLSAAVSHGYHLVFILALYGLGKGDDTPMLTVIGGVFSGSCHMPSPLQTLGSGSDSSSPTSVPSSPPQTIS